MAASPPGSPPRWRVSPKQGSARRSRRCKPLTASEEQYIAPRVKRHRLSRWPSVPCRLGDLRADPALLAACPAPCPGGDGRTCFDGVPRLHPQLTQVQCPEAERMARVTVEDCVQKVPNRFELVLLAAQRARNLSPRRGTDHRPRQRQEPCRRAARDRRRDDRARPDRAGPGQVAVARAGAGAGGRGGARPHPDRPEHLRPAGRDGRGRGGQPARRRRRDVARGPRGGHRGGAGRPSAAGNRA